MGTHTNQITALQTSDTAQNNAIAAIQSVNTSQTTAIAAIQSVNTSQSTAITSLQTSDTSQNTNITNLQSSDTSQNTLLATHTSQISTLQSSDTAQSTAIASLENKTQNISSTTTQYYTISSKPIYIHADGEVLQLLGTHGYIRGTSPNSNRSWLIGTETSGDKKLLIKNGNYEGIYLTTGGSSTYQNPGVHKIVTRSSGIQFQQGGIHTSDAIVGEIGATNMFNQNFYITNNGVNNLLIDAGLGQIQTYSDWFRIGSNTTNATTGRKSNLVMYALDGTTLETQSSAFTETLKTQIGTNTTNLQNITSTATATYMSKPLYINSSGEGMIMTGTNNYISGWSSTTNNRDWFIGTNTANVKKLILQNEKAESIYLQTGSRTGTAYTANSNLGQNKVVIHGLGISLKRGGITAGDAEITAGEIGALDPLNSNLYINGNSTNEIHINSGTGATVLNTNMLWVGSGTANANTRYSNIKMKNANNVWETQSSAFTEELKAKILSVESFYNGNGKLEFIAASFWWIGEVYNITALQGNTHYQQSAYKGKKNVGEWVYAFVNSGSSFFGSNGGYLLNDKPILTLVFEMDFNSSFCSVQSLSSKIIVENSAGTVLNETFFAGVRYNSERDTHHMNTYYNTAPLRHTLNQGDKIFVNTDYNIITPNSAAGITMKGKFSMLAN